MMQHRSYLQQCFHFCILLCSKRCQVHAQTVDKGLKGTGQVVSIWTDQVRGPQIVKSCTGSVVNFSRKKGLQPPYTRCPTHTP